jgi:hypothetical protein
MSKETGTVVENPNPRSDRSAFAEILADELRAIFLDDLIF